MSHFPIIRPYVNRLMNWRTATWVHSNARQESVSRFVAKRVGIVWEQPGAGAGPQTME